MTTQVAVPTRSNALLWVLLGILGVSAAGYFYTMPAIDRLRTVRATSAALAEDVQAAEALIASVSQLDGQLETRTEVLERLNLAFPVNPDLEELIVSLESMAAEAGVVLETVEPAGATTAAGQPVSLGLQGSYRGLRLFLDLLATNHRPLVLSELAIHSSSNVTGASLVQATLGIVAATAPTVGGQGQGTSQSTPGGSSAPATDSAAPSGGPRG